MVLRWATNPELLSKWAAQRLDIHNDKTRVILPPEMRKFSQDPGFWYVQEHVGDNFLADDWTVIYAPFEFGKNVYIGFNVVIHPGCTIGSDVVIESGTTVPRNTNICDGKTWAKDDEVTSLTVILKERFGMQ